MSSSRRILLGLAPLSSLLLPFFLYQSCKFGADSDIKETVADEQRFSGIQLRMVANEKTGSVVATFPIDGKTFKRGQKVDLVWDVVATFDPVNCSTLKRKQQVTINGKKNKARVWFRVNPKEFESGLRPDPQGLMKVDPVALANYKGPKLIEGCLVIPGEGVKLTGAEHPDPQAKDPSGLQLADGEEPTQGTDSGTNPGTDPGTVAGGDNADEADEPAPGDDSDLPVHIRYAERCSKAIGYVKPFSCIDAGVTVPINTDGVLQTTTPDRCDKPHYLPTGPNFCNTDTRVGRVTLYKDKTYTEAREDGKAVYFCRHYNDVSNKTVNGDPATSGPNYPYFDDVAIIMQNEETGKACFFQALGSNNLYGKRVPSPTETDAEWQQNITEAEKTAGARSAKLFWLPPSSIAQIHCVSCHDSDPFMHSPWIDQVRTAEGELMVPSIPDTAYNIIGAGFGFEKWSTSYSVEPEDSKCTSCHRIGSMQTCRTWMRDAYPIHDDGAAPAGTDFYMPQSRTQTFLDHPKHHWMPPPPTNEEQMAGWVNKLASYKKSAEDLRRCCSLKGPDGKRILSYGKINEPAGRVLGQQEIDFLGQSGCPVSQISTVIER